MSSMVSDERPLAPASEAPESEAPAPRPGAPWWRVAAMALGLGALAWVIRSVGLERIVETLVAAAAWMPLVILADLSFFACETMAYRAVLGPGVAAVPARHFVATSLVYYCVMVLAPLGRLGAEVARAAALSPWVGAGRATAAASNMQAGVLLANFVITVPAWLAVAGAVGPDHPLAWLLALNGLGTGAVGAVTLLIVRRSRVGRWLGARFPRLARLGADLDDAVAAPPVALARSLGWCVAARAAQLGQYAALLAAIGAIVTPSGTLVAMGVHLVGAGFGDLVPNQIGVLEGAYRIFADAVGLADDPARAVSIALLARVSQIVIASAGLVILALRRWSAPAR